jgi:hypothetical protein
MRTSKCENKKCKYYINNISNSCILYRIGSISVCKRFYNKYNKKKLYSSDVMFKIFKILKILDKKSDNINTFIVFSDGSGGVKDISDKYILEWNSLKEAYEKIKNYIK